MLKTANVGSPLLEIFLRLVCMTRNYYFKAMKIIEGRNKIILHNNNCIIETIAFYEHIL